MENYILIITMHADPAMPPGYDEWGGTHTYMRELLDAFEENKINCILVTRRSMEQLPYKEQYNSYCQIIRLTNGNNHPMNKQNLRFYHEQNIKEILKIINQQGILPFVIHSVYWNSGRLAREISQEIGVPYVHSVISNAYGRIHRGAFEPIEQRAQYEQNIYEDAKKILCVSEDEKQDLVEFYKINPKKIIVCGQYIAASFLSPAHDSNGFPKIIANISEEIQEEIASQYNKALKIATLNDNFWLYKAFTYFGRMDINKGILQILEAWYSLYNKYKECCPPLWLAGGSLSEIAEIRKKILQIIPDLNILEKNCKIFWWGYLTTEGLSTILLKSLVLLAHSLYEPGGRVIVEAMSEGVPVIATPNGFAKDIICDWENGFLVDYGDVNELSKRMELFIRQPLLSNSLGISAKKCAKNIINKWNFVGEHLAAYGINAFSNSNIVVGNNNYLKSERINIYPYCNMELSDNYIRKAFSLVCNEDIVSIREADTETYTSNIKEIKTDSGNYIVKHCVQCLSTEPFYNPLSAKTLVKDSQDQFNIETNFYVQRKSSIFIGKDCFHRLLFLKKLSLADSKKDNYLENCINYLCSRENILTPQDKSLYIRAMNKDIQNYDDIIKQFSLLQSVYPNYCFEYSGFFSNMLSWKIAPYLIAYNKHILGEKIQNELEAICSYFGLVIYEISCKTVRDINLGIDIRHIMTDGENIYLIDHKKTSIGIIESDIAALLYSYYCNSSYQNMHYFWSNIEGILDRFALKKYELISAFAFRLFYDIIVQSVLDLHTDIQSIADLNILRDLMESNKNEYNSVGAASRR